MSADEAPPWMGTSAYVHVPFCARACPYCDFDFVVGRRPDVDGYVDALSRQADAAWGATRPQVRTVYYGGGTPSSLGPQGLARLVEWTRARLDVSAVQEWTVELNPEHADAGLLALLVDAGIDRVSLGLQSARPSALRMLGRAHTADEGLAAMRRAIDAGLRVSADLIVGWPGQSRQALVDDLRAIVDTGAGHVSIYALTIEEGTPWARQAAAGKRPPVDDDRQAEHLVHVHDTLTAEGLAHYETASYARPGQIARHNYGYWSWRDVVAVGPSAASVTHGPDGGLVRRTAQRGFAAWRQAPGTWTEDRLSPVAAAAEGLWLGLRRFAGVAVPDLLARFAGVDEGWVRARVERQVRRGNLVWEGSTVRLSADRWLWHDEVGADLLVGPEDDAAGPGPK